MTDSPAVVPAFISKRSVSFRTALLVIGIGLVYLLLLPFAADIAAMGRSLTGRVGWIGLFLYVWSVDAFALPATVDFAIPLVVGWHRVGVVAVMGVASAIGGCCGYAIGRNLNHLSFVGRITRVYRARGEKLINKYGAWAIVLSAALPIPFSIVSWIAGMVGIPFRHYLLGAVVRIPRMAVVLILFDLGFRLVL